MSKLRKLHRGLKPKNLRTALIMQQLLKQAGSMEALKADFQGHFDRAFIQTQKEVYAQKEA